MRCAVLISSLLLTVACADKRPPEICHPATQLPSGEFFTDVTEDWGLSSVRGNTLSAADYDGDGRIDLFVSATAQHTTNEWGSTGQVDFLLHNTISGSSGGFDDVTETSGIASRPDGANDRAFKTLVWGDVDNDGDLDAFTGIVHDRNSSDTFLGDVHRILLNQGDGTFVPAPDSELSFDSDLAGATFVDFDRDGNLDLFLVNWYERYGALPGEKDWLLRGNGDGTFEDVTDDMGMAMATGSQENISDGVADRPSFGATACDVDDDGDADLLTSVYGRQWNMQWQNDGGGFSEIGRETGFAGDEEEDFADNGFYLCYCDVYGCDDATSPILGECATYADYWNPGWDDQSHRLNGNTFTTSCSDLDNDGTMDLVNAEIVHWHIGDSSDPSQVLLGNGDGTWTRPGNAQTGLGSRARSTNWNEGDIHVSTVDIDNDGWKDILLSSSDYDDNFARLWRQTDAGEFEDIAEEAGILHPRNVGVAIADFDVDGDLDLVLGSSTMRGGPWSEPEVHAYRNDMPTGNSSFIELVGTEANATGIGAKITVVTGELEQIYEVSGGYGHRGIQHTTGVHVGLGDACVIDRIEVRWPDENNSVDVYRKVRANYPVTLTQGGGVEYRTE